MTQPENNPVGFLQETCQKYNVRFPEYEEIQSTGPDHCKEFTIKCTFEGYEACGASRAKKQAKSESAKAMITLLNEKNYFAQFKGADIYNKTEGEVVGSTCLVSKNPISAINEFCQKHNMPLPRFSETSAVGTFICECKLNNKKTYGNGTNKKSAKAEAAMKMCTEFNIKCYGADYLLIESQVGADLQTEKNPVSALQELCDLSPSSKKVEYTEMPLEMNLFVIRCTLNSFQAEGKGPTKKIAKTNAASQVLAKLLAQPENGQEERKISTVSALSRILVSSSVNSENPNRSVLKDFNLESSEEEEEEENNKEKASQSIDDNLNVKLEALSLEPEHKLKEDSNIKSEEETNPESSEPAESSNLG